MVLHQGYMSDSPGRLVTMYMHFHQEAGQQYYPSLCHLKSHGLLDPKLLSQRMGCTNKLFHDVCYYGD